MKKSTAAALIAACLMAACASRQPLSPQDLVVRTLPPRNHESSITNYLDARAKATDPPHELVVGAPQRGTCPMGAKSGGYVGWVVPVDHKTRSKDSGVVTVTVEVETVPAQAEFT